MRIPFSSSSPRLSLFTGILCISIYPILIRITPVSGVTAAFYRLSIASLLLWPYILGRKQWKRETLRFWKPLVGCGLLFAADIASWNLSIQYSSATQASLLTNLSPIWVGLTSFLFLPQKPSPFFWIGAVVALTGLVLFMGLQLFTNLAFDRGFGLGLLSGICYAAYLMLSKKVLQNVNLLNFMACMTTVGSVFLLCFCVLGKQELGGFSTLVWESLLIQALVCQLLGWFSVSYALTHIPAQQVSISLLSQAVLTALLAWLLLGEQLSASMMLGGILLLTGIAITFRK
ncbi:EamA family transporter [Siphonobacter sp. BAB-5385]|uniref:DMT family transporter n=1 Tax=Siphonobacter sp. BAB-5385 TaxID=1864822 RepID=UPI000B9E0CF5|nr:DMT family transporter [Siphonobacter sp. BAB-5385]OZI07418.1 EamA family transporter [Siphonobacter sp. BAB-5385]